MLNVQAKHRSAKCQWQWAGYLTADVCMKFHKCRSLDVPEMTLNQNTKHCLAKHEKKVKASNSHWQWADCVMVDVWMCV